MSTALVWLRNDLRLADNPALHAAAKNHQKVVALYVHEEAPGLRPIGAAARWWLHQSLESIARDLAEIGVTLEVHAGKPEAVLRAALKGHDAETVYWNRRYGPAERELDAGIKQALKSDGFSVESMPGNVLIEPWLIQTGQDKPYSVFTPFWKNLRTMDIAAPLPAPKGKSSRFRPVDADYEEPHWAGKLGQYWSIGETAAQERLTTFLDESVVDYPEGRDFPAKDVTSRLSPHLRFGEISPRQIWHTAQAFLHAHHSKAGPVDKFLSELAWRDFSYHQLYHRPNIAEIPMQEKYSSLRWRHAPAQLRAWEKGKTGIPIVDAGLRELWETGYMHNRVRMLVASFLTKNLLIDWREGERWFWDCLVDADEANNPASWQWVAGCGLDAAPYFRIFNPVTQGERFDGSGDFVRRWVPEIAALPDKFIHAPADAPQDILAKADIAIGSTYPRPIADLKQTRQRALDAYGAVSAQAAD
ncbi:deoxyribodipyrimidine photo-lyase [Devosia lucknowensis]|uniref:Deoxyribodipyrimidine photo-lyase n=1 Tax=Devosia lucknowensis TaxID=1096929 RepID=A0A1Y6ETV0_9HYPH|nr:deoxyribodipyrimidine photo-lyase [Devosia lucknowensis]SMQ63623.1 deoxyribodipyrimidine photo-lyase [Devosia lucknowensis]